MVCVCWRARQAGGMRRIARENDAVRRKGTERERIREQRSKEQTEEGKHEARTFEQ